MRACSIILFLLPLLACGQERDDSKIVIMGSDSLGFLVRALSEEFMRKYPCITIEGGDPGSRTGILTFIDERADICPVTRLMTAEELERYTQRYGAAPVDIRVAWSHIAIYVHADNPVKQISMEQLARMYAHSPDTPETDKFGKPKRQFGSKLKHWGELDPTLAEEWKNKRIQLLSRHAASLTYSYFKNHALGHRDFDAACQELPSSSAVANGVTQNPAAIGFGGPVFMPGSVKILPLSAKDGEPGMLANAETLPTGKYPLTAPYRMYIKRNPKRAARNFMEFVLSDEGRAVIAGPKVGLSPLSPEHATHEIKKLP